MSGPAPIRECFAECWTALRAWLAGPTAAADWYDNYAEGGHPLLILADPDEPITVMYDEVEAAPETALAMIPGNTASLWAVACGEPDYGLEGRFQVREVRRDLSLGPIHEPASVERGERTLSRAERYAIGWETIFATLSRYNPVDVRRLATQGAVLTPVGGPYASKPERIAAPIAWDDFAQTWNRYASTVRPDGTLRAVVFPDVGGDQWQVRRIRPDGVVGDVEQHSARL